jgi:heme exporter protein A
MCFAAALQGRDASVEAGLAALRDLGLEDVADVMVRHLSQGQKRRVALARRCVPAGVPLWILDEPFNALDAGAIATFYAIINRHLATGGMVVLTAHQSVQLPAGARRLELAGEEANALGNVADNATDIAVADAAVHTDRTGDRQ